MSQCKFEDRSDELPPEVQMSIGSQGQQEFMTDLNLLEAGVCITQDDVEVNQSVVNRRKSAIFAFKHLVGQVLPELKIGGFYSLKFTSTQKVISAGKWIPLVRHWRTCKLEHIESLMHIHTVKFLLEDCEMTETESLDRTGKLQKGYIVGHNRLICDPLLNSTIHGKPLDCPCIQALNAGFKS